MLRPEAYREMNTVTVSVLARSVSLTVVVGSLVSPKFSARTRRRATGGKAMVSQCASLSDLALLTKR